MSIRPGPALSGSVLYCLIDSDNFFSGLPTVAAARHLLANLIAVATDTLGDFSRISIRLYGGWLQEGSDTQRAGQVAQLMSQAFPMPAVINDKILRGDWELAKALLVSPDIQFGDTLRRRASAPRLRLAQSPLPDGCISSSASCPAGILKKLTKSPNKLCPAPGCGVFANKMFMTVEQKQVDAMMMIDLIELSRRADRPLVLCVSDDTDFVPGLVAASLSSPNRVACCNVKHPYDATTCSILDPLGVSVVALGGTS